MVSSIQMFAIDNVRLRILTTRHHYFFVHNKSVFFRIELCSLSVATHTQALTNTLEFSATKTEDTSTFTITIRVWLGEHNEFRAPRSFLFSSARTYRKAKAKPIFSLPHTPNVFH